MLRSSTFLRSMYLHRQADALLSAFAVVVVAVVALLGAL
jgi:hypothetical protein